MNLFFRVLFMVVFTCLSIFYTQTCYLDAGAYASVALILLNCLVFITQKTTKMKKLTLTFAIVLFSTLLSFSQYLNYDIIDAMDFFDTEQLTNAPRAKVLTEKDIDGTPYLEDDFKPGTIYTTTKNKIVDIHLRYNIYNDELEFQIEQNQVLAIENPEMIAMAEFGGHKMKYIPYLKGQKPAKAFFRLIEDGEIALFAKSETAFEKTVPGNGIKAEIPARFVQKPDVYYLKTGDNMARKVGNKKELVLYFEEHQDEVAAFVKKNKVKTNKAHSLQELIAYYNSL